MKRITLKRFAFLVFVLLLAACQPVLLEDMRISQQVEAPELTLEAASPDAPTRKAAKFADL